MELCLLRLRDPVRWPLEIIAGVSLVIYINMLQYSIKEIV